MWANRGRSQIAAEGPQRHSEPTCTWPVDHALLTARPPQRSQGMKGGGWWGNEEEGAGRHKACWRSAAMSVDVTSTMEAISMTTSTPWQQQCWPHQCPATSMVGMMTIRYGIIHDSCSFVLKLQGCTYLYRSRHNGLGQEQIWMESVEPSINCTCPMQMLFLVILPFSVTPDWCLRCLSPTMSKRHSNSSF